MTGTLIHWLSFRNWRPSTTLSYKTNVIADSSACGLWPRTRSGLGHGGYKLNLANIVDRSPICSKNQLSSKFSDFAMALRMTSVMRLNSMVYLSKISLQLFIYFYYVQLISLTIQPVFSTDGEPAIHCHHHHMLLWMIEVFFGCYGT